MRWQKHASEHVDISYLQQCQHAHARQQRRPDPSTLPSPSPTRERAVSTHGFALDSPYATQPIAFTTVKTNGRVLTSCNQHTEPVGGGR